MSKTLQWIVGVSVGLIALAIVFSLVAPFFLPQTGWAGAAHPMMQPGHMFGGRNMMGFGMPFFGFGMLLVPALFIGLIVLGVVWLVRATTAAAPQLAAVCPHCGKPIAAGWKACPHCGEKL